MTTHKALVIDDDPVVASAIHRFLRQCVPASWTVQHEVRSTVGLSIAVVDRGVGFLIVDAVMPELAGDDLVEQLLEARPALRGRVVICSGLDFNEGRRARLFDELECERLDKPFRLEELELLAAKLVWKTLAAEEAERRRHGLV